MGVMGSLRISDNWTLRRRRGVARMAMRLVGVVLLVMHWRVLWWVVPRRVVTQRRLLGRREMLRRRVHWCRRRGCLTPRMPRDHGVEDALDEDAGVVLLQHLVAHLLVRENRRHDLDAGLLELEPHVGQLLPVEAHRPGDDLHVGRVDLEGVVRVHVGDEEGEGAVKVEEEGAELLADDDPVLAELLRDAVDDRVLDHLPEVDVRLVRAVQR